MSRNTAADARLSGRQRPDTPIPGLYRHYKGGMYRVLGLARHSETEQWLVVYQALYGERGFWARPHELFVSKARVDGREVARFECQDDATGGDFSDGGR